MSTGPELAAELAANPTSPAVRAKVALHLVEQLVEADVRPSGALWALNATLPDLKKAAYWLEQSELRARLTESQLRALCTAEVGAEDGE